eukprot:gnl/Hemi2/22381_TR7460_c0_g1_i1.p1 gnl/Hemi2/22381_TR7460_c0_g1~~gnl/Hemi2/22381_TR7460_c0_g1_i1.p1  ORF type:complete len:140 (-),score=11.63 gnl/Hemi2/22381_TR7460_c0_g1_i1:76-495(-)
MKNVFVSIKKSTPHTHTQHIYLASLKQKLLFVAIAFQLCNSTRHFFFGAVFLSLICIKKRLFFHSATQDLQPKKCLVLLQSKHTIATGTAYVSKTFTVKYVHCVWFFDVRKHISEENNDISRTTVVSCTWIFTQLEQIL